MSLTWNEYQQQALTTAIYPLKRELEYTAFGLLSELGELVSARAGGNDDDVKGELGDNFWYVAAMADALHTPLSAVYARLDTKRLPSVEQTVEAMTVMAGLIAGHIKKSIRDDDGFLSVEKQRLILNCLSKYMHHLEFLTDDYGTLNGILNHNLNKLADRQKRGVIGGSGDVR